MKAILSFILLFTSLSTYALDGIEFANCYRKASLDLIKTAGECGRLSNAEYEKIYANFSEDVDGVSVAYEAEDMLITPVEDFYSFIKETLKCDPKKAFQKILGTKKVLLNQHLTLNNEKFNLFFCQNIQ